MKALSLSLASLLVVATSFSFTSLPAATSLAGLSIEPPVLNGMVEGSLQVNSVPRSGGITINAGASIDADLLLPGSPIFRFNGGGTRPEIIVSDGPVEPAGYRVSINGQTSIGRIVTQSQPLEIPSTLPPLPSSGTQTLVINNPRDIPDDFSLFRSIIINRDVGEVHLPPGAYDQLVCNGGARIILGSPTEENTSAYDFRSLILNQGSVEVRGRVLLRLGTQLNINGRSIVGSPDHPEWLQLEMHQAGMNLNGNAQFFGRVLAPGGEIHLNGGTLIKGFALAKKIVLNGKGTLRFAETVEDVDPSDPPPVAIPASYSLWAGESFPFMLEAEQVGSLGVHFQIVEGPQHGQLINADGSPVDAGVVLSEEAFPLYYVSTDTFSGEDRITFTASNQNGISDPAVISFFVHAYLSPSLVFSLMPPEYTNQRRPTIRALVSQGSSELDPSSFAYFLNGLEMPVITAESGFEIGYEQDLLDGSYEVTFHAEDIYGYAASLSAVFFIDTVPPLIEAVSIASEAVLEDNQPGRSCFVSSTLSQELRAIPFG